MIFNGNGTVTVNRVTAPDVLKSVPIENPSAGYKDDYTRIKNEAAYNTYTIPSTCGLIYVEDHTWIEGVVDRKITVVAADTLHVGVVPDVVLRGNITYGAADGTDGLTVISEGNVLIAPDSPQDMNLNGIFIAQSGAFGRNLYNCTLPAYDNRGTLTIHGTTVSNKRTGTKWTYSSSSCGSNQTSGYELRIDAFDRLLATDPPPFTPILSTDYQFFDWRQE